MTERPPSPSVARRRVALKDASRRFAMAKRPSLTATRRLAPGTAGRDGGMVFRSNKGMGERASINFLTSRCPFKRFEGSNPAKVPNAT